MKTTDRSLSNSSNSFNTRGKQAKSFFRKVLLFPFPPQTGKQAKSLSQPQETLSSVYAQQTNNILTNSSESTPFSPTKFLHSRLSSLAGSGLLPIQVGGLKK